MPLLLGVTSSVLFGESVGLSGSSQFSPTQFANVLSVYQPSSLVLTPALLMALIQVVKQAPELAKSLQWVAVGARALRLNLSIAHELWAFLLMKAMDFLNALRWLA